MNNATVAIIGGGFSGTVAAIRLLSSPQRGGPSLPFGSKVVLIEPGRAGEGLAYRNGPDYWRLNVPAEKMSAFPEKPDDFLAFALARNPLVTGGDFLPRSWYGDYLSDRLETARRRSPRWLTFERVRARATAIDVARSSARIWLTDGAVVEADRVLLALGNPPAAGPLAGAAGVVDDAWNLRWMERLPTYVPRVLLVGTGLTMIDIALAISERRPDVRMTAISRHGLLPQPHENPTHQSASKFDATALVGRGPLSERLRRFRAQVVASGGDWRAALQQVRDVMPALWRAAPRRLRRRFLRHLRAQWDVHRHRLPAETRKRIETLREKKRLEIQAGRIVETRRIKDGVVVAWRPRGADAPREELYDAVVNVTGPDGNPTRSSCPLVQSLVEQTLCEPDGLGLGWGTDPDGRLFDANGNASEVLFYAGPLLRARHWEATAVPELRVHVARTAGAIASSLATGAGSYIRRVAAPIFRREQTTLY
jgi:uncharacterized NAD(P)/FAD-binding protein YdhS